MLYENFYIKSIKTIISSMIGTIQTQELSVGML